MFHQYKFKPYHIKKQQEKSHNENQYTPSVLSTFMTSLVAGSGATVGSRVIDSIIGPRQVQVNSGGKPDCEDIYKKFLICIKDNIDNPSSCEQILPDRCK